MVLVKPARGRDPRCWPGSADTCRRRPRRSASQRRAVGKGNVFPQRERPRFAVARFRPGFRQQRLGQAVVVHGDKAFVHHAVYGDDIPFQRDSAGGSRWCGWSRCRRSANPPRFRPAPEAPQGAAAARSSRQRVRFMRFLPIMRDRFAGVFCVHDAAAACLYRIQPALIV